MLSRHGYRAMRTHFCIVSEQPVPNLSAALDSRIRADRLVLFASPEMAERAGRLAAVASRHDIEVRQVLLRDRLDLAKVAEDVERVLDEEAGGSEVMLNVTGGQKPMSIAAYEVFLRRGGPAFYVDTDNSLVWLPPQRRERIELETHLTIEDYLQSYGARVERRSSDADPYAPLTAELVRRVSEFASVLGVLNALADAQRNGRPAQLQDAQMNSQPLRALLELWRRHGLIEWQKKARDVRFRGPAAIDYAAGGWLEHHVYGLVEHLRVDLGIAEVARGVQVVFQQRDGEVKNELDVVFLADNHLFLIECKTRRYSLRPADDEDELTGALYKLYALGRNLGGLAGRMALVSWNEARPHHRERAQTLNIRLVSAEQLRELPTLLPIFCRARQTR